MSLSVYLYNSITYSLKNEKINVCDLVAVVFSFICFPLGSEDQ